MGKKYGLYLPWMMGAGSLIYYILCVKDSGADTSGLWVWPLFAALCLAVGAGLLFCRKKGIRCMDFWAVRLWAVLTALLFAVFFLFEAGVVYGMCQHGRENLDYVIILGGGVVGEEPSPALRQRILTAKDYLEQNPETRAVASGGLGDEDTVSEGACIARELVKAGITPERIDVEEASATTAENMQFSRRLVEDSASVGIVTSNFHVFRSMMTARKAGFSDICGIAAPFGGLMLPHYMVREFMTFTVEVFRGNIF